MTIITDRHHLHRRMQNARRHLERLEAAWIAEDAFAHTPGSGNGQPGPGGPTDPTLGVIERPNRLASRDRIGSLIATTLDGIARAAQQVTPRTPSGPCNCCRRDTATHGHDRDGRPTSCWRCWRFLRDNDHRCDDTIHDERHYRRMCECPPTCCDVCPDDADEGRTLSSRCRKRIYRNDIDRTA